MNNPTVIPLWTKGSPNNNGGDIAMPNGEPSLVFFKPSVHGTMKKARPCILICSGGCYSFRAEHEGPPFAHFFGLHGIFSGVIHYRVSPNRHPAPFADAARAVRYVRANAEKLGVDPDRIGLMGFSAGGHLAATVGIQPNLWLDPGDDLANTVSARPDRIILGYPVVSAIRDYHSSSFVNLLGEEKSVDDTVRRQFSHELHVTKDSPPAFIFHTANDSSVPVQNSLRLAEAYAAAGVSCELHVFKDGPHGVGFAPGIPTLKIWTELMSSWMRDWIRQPFGD
ncbi:MAG: alpha/beta hydrolase [Lentisphaerota bacterium]